MSESQAGEPARKFSRPDTRAGHSPGGRWELIGPADCPIMWRWTILSGRLGKLLLHRFMPGASDKDCHDHPSSFVTVVLRGGYDDVSVCIGCEGEGVRWPDDSPCQACSGTGTRTDSLRAPTIRFRPAEHAHITKVGPTGATTIVVMGRKRRPWGFWRDGRWWAWRMYELKFGLNWRCDE